MSERSVPSASRQVPMKQQHHVLWFVSRLASAITTTVVGFFFESFDKKRFHVFGSLLVHLGITVDVTIIIIGARRA